MECTICLAEKCEGNSIENCRIQCDKCHPLCKTCTGKDPKNCQICNDDIGAIEIEPSGCGCPSHYYYDPNTEDCIECNYLCKTCSGPTSKDCLSCDFTVAFAMDYAETWCVGQCDIIGYYPFIDMSKTYCLGIFYFTIACHESCEMCFGDKENNCISCKEGVLRNDNTCSTEGCISPLT